jgi:hypothetical protein
MRLAMILLAIALTGCTSPVADDEIDRAIAARIIARRMR